MTVAPAQAHTNFLGSDPEEGAVLAELPTEVRLNYSEDLAPQFVDAAVVPPDGGAAPVEPRVEGASLVVPVAGAAPAADGEWQVVTRVVSADGHPVEHTVTVTVTGSAAGSGSGADATDAADPATDLATDPAPATDPATTTDPEPTSADPLAGQSIGGVGVVLVLATALAAVGALVVHLRRRP